MSPEIKGATAQEYLVRIADFIEFDLSFFLMSHGCRSYSCFSYDKQNAIVTIGHDKYTLHPELLTIADKIEFLSHGTLGVRVVVWPKPVPALGITRDHYIAAVYGYEPEKGKWFFAFDPTSGCERYQATPSTKQVSICRYGDAWRLLPRVKTNTAVIDRINLLHYASTHLTDAVALASLYRESHPDDNRLISYELSKESGEPPSIFGVAYPGYNPFYDDWPSGDSKILKFTFAETSKGKAVAKFFLGSRLLADSGSPGQTQPDLALRFEYDPKGGEFPRFPHGAKILPESACANTAYGNLCPNAGTIKLVE